MKSRRQISVRVDDGCLSAFVLAKRLCMASGAVYLRTRNPRQGCREHAVKIAFAFYVSSSPSVSTPKQHKTASVEFGVLTSTYTCRGQKASCQWAESCMASHCAFRRACSLKCFSCKTSCATRSGNSRSRSPESSSVRLEEAEARLALERAEGSQRRVETLEAEALLGPCLRVVGRVC